MFKVMGLITGWVRKKLPDKTGLAANFDLCDHDLRN